MLKSTKCHCLIHRFSRYNILTNTISEIAVAMNRPTIHMHFIRNSSGLMLKNNILLHCRILLSSNTPYLDNRALIWHYKTKNLLCAVFELGFEI